MTMLAKTLLLSLFILNPISAVILPDQVSAVEQEINAQNTSASGNMTAFNDQVIDDEEDVNIQDTPPALSMGQWANVKYKETSQAVKNYYNKVKGKKWFWALVAAATTIAVGLGITKMLNKTPKDKTPQNKDEARKIWMVSRLKLNMRHKAERARDNIAKALKEISSLKGVTLSPQELAVVTYEMAISNLKVAEIVNKVAQGERPIMKMKLNNSAGQAKNLQEELGAQAESLAKAKEAFRKLLIKKLAKMAREKEKTKEMQENTPKTAIVTEENLAAVNAANYGAGNEEEETGDDEVDQTPDPLNVLNENMQKANLEKTQKKAGQQNISGKQAKIVEQTPPPVVKKPVVFNPSARTGLLGIMSEEQQKKAREWAEVAKRKQETAAEKTKTGTGVVNRVNGDSNGDSDSDWDGDDD